VPHTVDVGATLLLFACARSKWEGYGLAVLGYGGALGYAWLNEPSLTLTEGFAAGWPALLLGVYVPVLLLVLLPADKRTHVWAAVRPLALGRRHRAAAHELAIDPAHTDRQD
jgi:hypothetical protein